MIDPFNLTPIATIDPIRAAMVQNIPPNAFVTTWDTLGAVACISGALGMICGAATLYVAQQVRVYLRGELMQRDPHAQRSNRPQRHFDPEDDEEETEVTI